MGIEQVAQVEAAFKLGIEVNSATILLGRVTSMLEGGIMAERTKKSIADDFPQYRQMAQDLITKLRDYQGREFEKLQVQLQRKVIELEKAAKPYLPR